MSPVSLNEKLNIIWSVISSSPLYIVFFLAIAVLIYLFSTTNNANRKQSKKTYFLIYSAFFIYLIIQYGGSFGTLVDYAVNQVFIGYYFPNIVIYIMILLIATIITLVSIFSKKVSRVIKILNSIIYGLLVYFLVLVLSLVNSLKVNVFDLTALYSSEKVRSLLEFSMFLFVTWVLVLVAFHFVRKFQEKKTKTEEFTNYNVVRDFVDKEVFIPQKTENVYIKPPVVSEQTVVQEAKQDPFTLEDYKLMLKILKEEKEKEEQRQSTPLTDLNRLYQGIGE